MAIVSLRKGEKISLSKQGNFKKVIVGLGWTSRDGADLDASAFLLNEYKKTSCDNDFVFYNNLQSNCASVLHTGDDLEGGSGGDDETLIVDLSKVPARVKEIVFTVTIHDPEGKGLKFGQLNNAFIRIVNEENDSEIARYELAEDFSKEDFAIFGKLKRDDDNWSFDAVGEAFTGGLLKACGMFGIDASN